MEAGHLRHSETFGGDRPSAGRARPASGRARQGRRRGADRHVCLEIPPFRAAMRPVPAAATPEQTAGPIGAALARRRARSRPRRTRRSALRAAPHRGMSNRSATAGTAGATARPAWRRWRDSAGYRGPGRPPAAVGRASPERDGVCRRGSPARPRRRPRPRPGSAPASTVVSHAAHGVPADRSVAGRRRIVPVAVAGGFRAEHRRNHRRGLVVAPDRPTRRIAGGERLLRSPLDDVGVPVRCRLRTRRLPWCGLRHDANLLRSRLAGERLPAFAGGTPRGDGHRTNPPTGPARRRRPVASLHGPTRHEGDGGAHRGGPSSSPSWLHRDLAGEQSFHGRRRSRWRRQARSRHPRRLRGVDDAVRWPGRRRGCLVLRPAASDRLPPTSAAALAQVGRRPPGGRSNAATGASRAVAAWHEPNDGPGTLGAAHPPGPGYAARRSGIEP